MQSSCQPLGPQLEPQRDASAASRLLFDGRSRDVDLAARQILIHWTVQLDVSTGEKLLKKVVRDTRLPTLALSLALQYFDDAWALDGYPVWTYGGEEIADSTLRSASRSNDFSGIRVRDREQDVGTISKGSEKTVTKLALVLGKRNDRPVVQIHS